MVFWPSSWKPECHKKRFTDLRANHSNTLTVADMAKLAYAPVLGTGGRPCRFESCYPHLKYIKGC